MYIMKNQIEVVPLRIRTAAIRKFRSLAASCGVTHADLFGMLIHGFSARLERIKEKFDLPSWTSEYDSDLLLLFFEHDMGRASEKDFTDRVKELKNGAE